MDANQLTVKRHRSMGECRDLWTRAMEADKRFHPMLRYDYMANIFRQMRLWPGYDPCLLSVSDRDGRMLMIAPLKKKWFKGKVRFLGAVQGCAVTDFIFAPELTDAERAACVRALADYLRGRKIKFEIKRVITESPTAGYLRAAGFKDDSHFDCVAIDFAEGHEAWFKRLSSSTRQNVRTAHNRINRDGLDARLEVFFGPISPELQSKVTDLYLRRLFSLYKHRGPLHDLIYKTFYRKLKHDSLSLARLDNTFHALLLKPDGTLLCFMAGFVDEAHTTIYVPRLAIDDAFRFYSPGYVLIDETVKYLCEHTTVRRLDLLRGVERYKTDLGGVIYTTVGMH